MKEFIFLSIPECLVTVVIDAVSIDLFEKYSGKKISEVAFDLPYRHQLEYAKEIGFGNVEYEIVKV